MKKTIYIPLCVLLLLSCNPKSKKELALHTAALSPMSATTKIDYSIYYQEAKRYCRKNKLNQNIFILIDLSEHSGFKRF